MVFISLLTNLATALISGSISMSNSLIQQTSVTYTFKLSFAQQIDASGKLIIRFPPEFSSSANSNLNCQAVSGFSNPSSVSCSYNSEVRLMTITKVFPTVLNSIQFTIGGVTNPSYASKTSLFVVRSYNQNSGGQFTLLETSGTDLTVTPTAGSLSSVSLTAINPTVGTITSLQVNLTTQHIIPGTGQIQLTFPKWNTISNSGDADESYIVVSTSPGPSTCTSILGFYGSSLPCTFTQGSLTDTLVIQVTNDSSSSLAQVSASKKLSILIANVRTPPSTAQITTISLATANNQGQVIDQLLTGITYEVSTPATLPSSYVTITASQPQIQTDTTLTIRIQNQNPIPAGSILVLTVPTQFGMSKIKSVTGSGSRINPTPVVTFSKTKYQITVTGFNTDYLGPYSNTYINLIGVTTPNSTLQTSTFTVLIYDQSSNPIEKVDSSVTFQATPGSFSNPSIQASQSSINQWDTQFQFTFTPQNGYNISAMLCIVFPDQITINNREQAKIWTAHNGEVSSKTQVIITQNKYVNLTSVFDYNRTTSPQQIQFTLDGITNPSSIATTDSFQIYLYYPRTGAQNQLLSGLTFTATVNPSLSLEVLLASQDTGFNNMLQFKIDTLSYQVLKGSYLKVTIPRQFQIYDPDMSADSCFAISGFQDEISCQFTQVSNGLGHILLVEDGFASNTFAGGELIFNISQIRNPQTTIETDAFRLQIYDSADNLQYEYASSGYTLMMRPCPFSYAQVSSGSPVNGQSTMYTFTLTLSVDTPTGAMIQVNPPAEISLDTSKGFTCGGLLNLNATLYCLNVRNQAFFVRVRPPPPDNSASSPNQVMITNGTSISFQLGPFVNPLSLIPSSSFLVTTYVASSSGLVYYYMNREAESLTIQNTAMGQISNLNISQVGSQELGTATAIRLQFKSQNVIPRGSYVVLTIPGNFQIANSYEVIVNGATQGGNTLSYNKDTKQFKIQVQASSIQQFDITISKGLINPASGPYSYSNFLIQILSDNGYAIDQFSSAQAWISVNCTNNCTTCSSLLSQCSSCSVSQDASSKTSFYMHQQMCMEKCPSGMFGDTDYVCKSCQYPCVECSHGASLCTVCSSDTNNPKPYAYPPMLTCYDQCPSGTYLDTTAKLCVKCQSPCYTCSSAKQCLTCDRSGLGGNKAINYFSGDKQCYEQCPTGTMQTPSNQCLKCAIQCSTCKDSPEMCTSCSSPSTFLFGYQCLSKCPAKYRPNYQTNKCDPTDEMILPLPFSILAFVISFGLLIARFMKNSTRYFITALALIDILVKVNWVFLFAFLLHEKHRVSAGIIGYCLGASFAINFGLWRLLYRMLNLKKDQVFLNEYVLKYPLAYKVILYLSFTVSLQAFRLSYCRLLGKRIFSAHFDSHNRLYQSVMGNLTLLNLVVIYLPALTANIYNLFYTNSAQELYYLDIDSLILVLYICILFVIVVKYNEKFAMLSLSGKTTKGKKSVNSNLTDQDGEQVVRDELEIRTVGDLMKQMRKQSIFKRKFQNLNEINQSQENNQHQESTVNDITTFQEQKMEKQLGKSGGAKSTAKSTAAMKYYKTTLQPGLDKDGNPINQNQHRKYFSRLDNEDEDQSIDNSGEEYRLLQEKLKKSQSKQLSLAEILNSIIQKKNETGYELNLTKTENEGLLAEQQRLERQLKLLQDGLLEFGEVAKQELEETEQLRRDQIKHKVNSNKLKKLISQTVLEQGKKILQQDGSSNTNTNARSPKKYQSNSNINGMSVRQQHSLFAPTESQRIRNNLVQQQLYELGSNKAVSLPTVEMNAEEFKQAQQNQDQQFVDLDSEEIKSIETGVAKISSGIKANNTQKIKRGRSVSPIPAFYGDQTNLDKGSSTTSVSKFNISEIGRPPLPKKQRDKSANQIGYKDTENETKKSISSTHQKKDSKTNMNKFVKSKYPQSERKNFQASHTIGQTGHQRVSSTGDMTSDDIYQIIKSDINNEADRPSTSIVQPKIDNFNSWTDLKDE